MVKTTEDLNDPEKDIAYLCKKGLSVEKARKIILIALDFKKGKWGKDS